MAVLLAPEQRWECVSCDSTEVTYLAEPHTRFHRCRGLLGLTTPYVPAGTKAKHVIREREDYVGKELVQTDGTGRPVLSVETWRDEGQDAAVFAPCAQMRTE